MRRRSIIFSVLGFSLLMGFQNCSAPTAMDVNAEGDLAPKEKATLNGRYIVSHFIATSSCPDIDSGEMVCSSVYDEDSALTDQAVEFLNDGTLVVEGACNTYYSSYTLSSSGSLGQFNVETLNGTSNTCSGDEAEEESLLVYRLQQAVRIVEDGPSDLSLYTDQSSALRLRKN